MSILAYVPVEKIIKECSTKTEWEKGLILADYVKFVSVTRKLVGIPRVKIRESAAYAMNCLPVFTAAESAVPPIDPILCTVEATAKDVEHLGFRLTTPGELLDTDDQRNSSIVVFFTRDISDSELTAIRAQLAERAATCEFLTNERSVVEICMPPLKEAHSAVALTFSNAVLPKIHKIVPLRSINGSAYRPAT